MLQRLQLQLRLRIPASLLALMLSLGNKTRFGVTQSRLRVAVLGPSCTGAAVDRHLLGWHHVRPSLWRWSVSGDRCRWRRYGRSRSEIRPAGQHVSVAADAQVYILRRTDPVRRHSVSARVRPVSSRSSAGARESGVGRRGREHGAYVLPGITTNFFVVTGVVTGHRSLCGGGRIKIPAT